MSRNGTSMQVAAPAEPYAGAGLPATHCGAKTRAGKVCRHAAGFRTDHAGQGRCYLHGGATPIKHGRYSSITRPRLRELIEAHAADPSPLDTLPELAAARALFQDFIERYDVNTAALLAWHRSWKGGLFPLSADKEASLIAVLDEYEEIRQGGDGLTESQAEQLDLARQAVEALTEPPADKPAVVLDISDAYRIVSEITKIVERIEKVRAANAISYQQLRHFFLALERTLAVRIKDPALLQQLQGDILAIQV